MRFVTQCEASDRQYDSRRAVSAGVQVGEYVLVSRSSSSWSEADDMVQDSYTKNNAPHPHPPCIRMSQWRLRSGEASRSTQSVSRSIYTIVETAPDSPTYTYEAHQPPSHQELKSDAVAPSVARIVSLSSTSSLRLPHPVSSRRCPSGLATNHGGCCHTNGRRKSDREACRGRR